jgi:magnesium transporter
MDHMNKICDTLDESTDIIEVFKDADYLLSSYRANRGIRALVVMFAIAIPLLTIFGLYVIYALLFNGISESNHYFFFVISAIALTITGVVLYLFHRRHLI